MGADKALLSRALAKVLGYQYVDASFRLERVISRLLNKILSEQGAVALRVCESEIITSFCTIGQVVMDLYPSTIEYEKNRELLSLEHVIYLKLSFDE